MSPAMHNAAYAALAMDRIYVACSVAPDAIADAIRAIPALGLVGVNLTVPHKEAAARILDNVSAEAKLLGAVNCIVNRRGRLFGDNTDARGLEPDLRELGIAIRRSTVIVIGAGGAAASAVLASIRLGAGRIVLANRTQDRAQQMADRFARGNRTTIFARGLDALVDRTLLSEAALVINATPMGLTTRSFARLDYRASPPGCFFYDMIYSIEPTPFLRPAIAIGRGNADGAGMLVNQGELAFALFNRVAPPRGVMRRALMDRLGR